MRQKASGFLAWEFAHSANSTQLIRGVLPQVKLRAVRLCRTAIHRRKKEAVDFDASESGMTAYFCARYENQKGEHGSWGPVVSAIIP
jgi:hypothetical protein